MNIEQQLPLRSGLKQQLSPGRLTLIVAGLFPQGLIVKRAVPHVARQGDARRRLVAYGETCRAFQIKLIIAAIAGLQIAFRLPANAGFAADVVDRAGRRVAPVQGVLRPPHDLHPLHVEGAEGDGERRIERHIVQVHPDGADHIQMKIGGADAANEIVGLRSALRQHAGVRHMQHDLLGAEHPQFAQALASEGLHRNRHILQRFRAFLRGDDHFLNLRGNRRGQKDAANQQPAGKTRMRS